MSKQQIRFIKGNITDYNKDKMQGVIYFAEDKKKIIVDDIEYGLDLESDEVDLISNIEHRDNKLTINFSNGKTKEIELEDHRTYWEDLFDLFISEFPMGGCIISTHPIKEFSFKGDQLSAGKWYSSDGQEGEYNSNLTVITFEEEGEYTIKFVNNYKDGENGLKEVTDNTVKSVLMIGGSNGATNGIKPVNKKENAKLIFHNITSIDSSAFNRCSGFTSLKLPEYLKSIGNEAFEYCTGFTGELKLPESITSIGNYAFQDTKFTGDLKLPESLTSIGNYAFNLCSGFTGDLIIPDSVTSIGTRAFYNCSGLSRIYVCEDTELGDLWNSGAPAEVIKYKKGETPWLTKKK